MDLNLSDNNLYIFIGTSLISFGLIWVYSIFKNKKIVVKPKEHTICPNCKQTYNFKDLKDGKCPTCKDTNTIEIEQYYKDNPFKDEDDS